jgi:hypothetical protein
LEALKRDAGVYEIDPEGQIHLAATDHEKAGTLQRRAEAGGEGNKAAKRVGARPRRSRGPSSAKEPSEHVPARKETVQDTATRDDRRRRRGGGRAHDRVDELWRAQSTSRA